MKRLSTAVTLGDKFAFCNHNIRYVYFSSFVRNLQQWQLELRVSVLVVAHTSQTYIYSLVDIFILFLLGSR